VLASASLLLIAIVGWVLVPRYGVIGAAYSYLGNLLLLIQIYYAARHMWGHRWFRKSLAVFSPVVVSGALVTIGFFWSIRAPLQTWYSIVIYTVMIIICLLVCTFVLDRRFFLSQLHSLLRGSANAEAG
jgi:putative flippase GtrA